MVVGVGMSVGTGVFVAEGTGVFVAEGTVVFVAEGIGVFVAVGGTGVFAGGGGPGPSSDRVVGVGTEGGEGTSHWCASSCPAAVCWSRLQYGDAFATTIGRAGLATSRFRSRMTD